jgi:ribosomal-protein-alanine N-acetyltransferase
MIGNFSPFPQLATKRLVLRELKVADAPLIHKLRSDTDTNDLLDRKNSSGIEDALLFIQRVKDNVGRKESIYWIICFENASDLIGTIGFWNYNLSAETAEIGYELLVGFRGQGIMSEVLPRVIKFGFEQMKLKFITAYCSPQNACSINLLEKFGFRLSSSSSSYDNTNQNDPGMLLYVLASAQ